ncbi:MULTISPECIES: S24/S26 family peptidase [Bacillus cereus group]|uniref:S24/S26 family peptidase n=1 Tax=Bacillus cereus group TaxID=86661 RepID=UPI000BEE0F2F|nr:MULTISPECIES: S24/S26 family peptidase [Bacillus cereus group]PEF88542.1 hypothetical protein CON51_04890 [Bacillus thuringiensis]PES54719.1 hypothetical protein CN506_19690 [Bacillus thuringiensis]PEV88431.1 hypothetical protein CN442_20760 [Bacillus thuringiensis]PFK91013.1 hypothetical protein COJ04_21705 [Bacillus thuringiensis]PFP03589.1 hypothetical protein COJ91_22630 [Bacillus thuringiensis]
MNNVQANEIKIGMKLSGALAIQAMSTFKIRNTTDPNFVFWFNEQKEIVGHIEGGGGSAGEEKVRQRDISYFMANTFEVIATIKPAFEHGDLVEVTTHSADAELSKGEIVTFDTYRDGYYPVRVVKENGTSAIILESDIRKLTEDEVKKHLEAENKRKVNALSEGDIVKITQDGFTNGELNVGDLAVVVRQDPTDSETPVRIRPLGKHEGYSDSEWARHYEVEIPTKEEIKKAEVIEKVAKVAEGTLIRITGRDATKPKYGDHALSNGKVIKVSRKRAGSKDAIRGFVDDVNGTGTFEYTVHGGDFEIMASDEINAHEAKKLNLSKGEYLVVAKKGAGEIEAGTVVVSNGNQYSGGVEVSDLEGNQSGFKYAYNLRRAEASEVAKAKEDIKEKKARKVFEKLGRSYGEFKQGDIVRVTDPLGGDFKVGDMSEVESGSTINFRCVLKATHQTQTGRYAEVELITPVEQRLDK